MYVKKIQVFDLDILHLNSDIFANIAKIAHKYLKIRYTEARNHLHHIVRLTIPLFIV